MRVQCSSCGKEYNLAESMVGKTVKCRECDKPFVVRADQTPPPRDNPPQRKTTRLAASDAVKASPRSSSPERAGITKEPSRSQRPSSALTDDDRPRRRSRADEDDEDDRPRRRADDEDDDRHKESSGMGLWIGLGAGGVGAMLLLGVLGYFFFAGSKPVANPPGLVVQNDNIAAQDKLPNNPPNFAPNNPPANNNPKTDPSNINPKKGSQPPPAKPPAPVELVVPWSAKPDPGPDLAKAPKSPASVAIAPAHQLVFPTTASPYVLVKNDIFRKDNFQVVDLFRSTTLYTIPSRMDLSDPVLSPDGKLLAGRAVRNGKMGVEIYSLGQAKLIQTLPMDKVSPRMIDFVEDDHLLTAATQVGKTQFTVWNIKTGQSVKEFSGDSSWDDKGHALSPGRKYFALLQKDKIKIFKVLDGELVGQLNFTAEDMGAFSSCKGLAFSHDGLELACLREGAAALISSWNMSDGSLAKQHKFDKTISSIASNATSRANPPVDWLPLRGGWFFFGQVMVDYDSGSPVFTMPQKQGDALARLVGKDHIVQLGGTPQQRALEIQPLPREQIADAVKAARGGGNQPSQLPAATTADVAAAKVLPAPTGNVAWKVPADVATVASNLARQPIQLQAKAKDILKIVFSAKDKSKAAVLYGFAANPLAFRKTVRVDEVDLVAGKTLGTMDLFSADFSEQKPIMFQGKPLSPAEAVRADLSPEGTRLVTFQGKEPNRLDLWDLANKKHLAGWVPHADGPVSSFAFLDGERVLTCGGQGQLILWKVPECKAIYKVDGYRGDISLSYGNRLLLAFTGTSLEVLDPATGQRLGQLEPPGGTPTQLLQASFAPDGKTLVALCSTGVNVYQVASWNLAGGTWTGNVPVGNNAPLPLTCLGGKTVLRGSCILDFNVKAELVQYLMPGNTVFAQGSPDGRVWFATEFGPNNLTIFGGQPFADPRSQALVAAAAAGAIQRVFTQGATVQINLSTNVDKVKTSVDQSLAKHLERQGYKIGPGGLTLNISAQDAPTGKTIDYEISTGLFPPFPRPPFGPRPPLGKGGRQIIQIAERRVTCGITATDPQGAQVYTTTLNFSTPSSLTFQGDTYQAQLDDAVHRSAAGAMGSVNLPSNLFRIDGQVAPLPVSLPLPR